MDVGTSVDENVGSGVSPDLESLDGE